jgi:hypothetical protein
MTTQEKTTEASDASKAPTTSIEDRIRALLHEDVEDLCAGRNAKEKAWRWWLLRELRKLLETAEDEASDWVFKRCKPGKVIELPNGQHVKYNHIESSYLDYSEAKERLGEEWKECWADSEYNRLQEVSGEDS